MVKSMDQFRLFIKLFHGREDPEVDMDDWGLGPHYLGPFGYVHSTYASDLKMEYYDRSAELTLDVCLYYYKDMLYYDGIFYGDFSVSTADRFRIMDVMRFDQRKADLPEKYRS